ncbi:hypothetical protein HPP92_009714 [Vanilla planifolia]|uniref:Bifunctional inhibitor/plant lipid transfer protein/seed storage helical domain-containing protein n=1 Tax=Vanilla planifolia TaxID=51239 RepID=A0A835RET1_VANPL|nr:hypothetical protein HPP92_009714 [Vanilla planifolia]
MASTAGLPAVAATTAATIIALLLISGTEPTAAAAGPSQCNMTQQGFEDCLPYIRSTPAPATGWPSEDCCSALRKADLSCLCSYKGSPLLSYLHISYKLALQLPAKCGLRLPSPC